MKVLLIDPWGINNTSEYLNGLISGFSGIVDLTVYTNVYFEQYVDANANVHKVFFRRSERMTAGKKRTVIRGFEYIKGYCRVLKELKRDKYDVVHINWLLNYKLDIIFLKQIKKYCTRLVYTAHNVLPHVDGEESIDELRQIYSIVDRVIVHGETIKEELIATFPGTSSKVYVQKHGCVIQEPPVIDESQIPNNLKELISEFPHIYISCGAVFPNKGIDRLLKIWLEKYANTNNLLVVGGRQMADYPEYENLKQKARETNNICILDGFIDDSIMNYLFTKCSAVILPYRHASMSGIVFSAAQYAKPIMCTNVGALTEYLEPGVDSVICENDDKSLEQAVKTVIETDPIKLEIMGKKLKDNIRIKCDWENICSGVLKNVYKEEW